jgi:hypothetical protein
MNLKDIIGKLPESDRVEAEKVIQEAIVAANPLAGVDSKEKAAEFIAKNTILKGAFDAGISKAVEDHDTRFKAEKLPKIVEAEIKKLTGPETDPIKLELAQIKAEREAEKAEARRDKQRAVALKIAAEEKIPVKYIDSFLDEDDLKTTAKVKDFAAEMKKWATEQTEAVLKERLGNNGKPSGGTLTPPADLLTKYNEALKDPKRADEALALHEQLESAARTAK